MSEKKPIAAWKISNGDMYCPSCAAETPLPDQWGPSARPIQEGSKLLQVMSCCNCGAPLDGDGEGGEQ